MSQRLSIQLTHFFEAPQFRKFLRLLLKFGWKYANNNAAFNWIIVSRFADKLLHLVPGSRCLHTSPQSSLFQLHAFKFLLFHSLKFYIFGPCNSSGSGKDVHSPSFSMYSLWSIDAFYISKKWEAEAESWGLWSQLEIYFNWVAFVSSRLLDKCSGISCNYAIDFLPRSFAFSSKPGLCQKGVQPCLETYRHSSDSVYIHIQLT